MPDGENQDDVVGGQPTVLCDVPVPAARQDQLATAVFCDATEQRVLGEQSERCMYARGLFSRPLRIAPGDAVEHSFEIAERARGYFDARHERARGRRRFLPRIRAAR